jgi:phospholipid-binding lipoprotein MlaA
VTQANVLRRAGHATAPAARAATLVVMLGVAGCATAPSAAPGTGAANVKAVPANPIDPWENWNRKVFVFNEALDAALLKPVAQAYHDVVPRLVRTGVDNVLGNLYDVWSAANNLLQGKVQVGLEMGMRVLTNTFFGLGGLLDPATEMRLTRRSEDFGQTLGVWGLGNGPFVELPLFGPSTLRDTAGLVVDRRTAPSTLPESASGRYGVAAIEVINTRTKLLGAGNLVDRVALDKYSFIRDAYLARRRDALYDGAPPMETFDEDDGDAAAGPAPAAASSPAGPASAPAAAHPASAAASAAQ